MASGLSTNSASLNLQQLDSEMRCMSAQELVKPTTISAREVQSMLGPQMVSFILVTTGSEGLPERAARVKVSLLHVAQTEVD